MQKKIPVFLLLFCCTHLLYAQDTLPHFSVTNFGAKKNLINWVNNYPALKQISIQRSYDSTKNFKTILTVPDPMNKENGYLDTKAPYDKMFYRLFIVIDGANFVFSPSKRPFFDTTSKTAVTNKVAETSLAIAAVPNSSSEDSITVMVLDTLTDQYIPRRIKNDRVFILSDSASSLQLQGLKGSQKPVVFMPSLRIYTNSEGYLRISLEDYAKKKYSVKFYEDDNSFLFELKEITRPFLVLDKTNFYHAGWFRFELFDDGKLIEKHKFFISKGL
ncbi:MAG: hypothetical protein GC171_14610 [Terrimonas sp.]|nr:hypothetical protein [Terrimonas sp.]